MAILNWMGEHPFLTFILAFLLYAAISDTASAIGSGMAGKSTASQCSKPAAPADQAKDRP